MTFQSPKRELRPETNPATGKMAIAVYIDSVNMGYAESYKDADSLAAEIVAKRAAAQTAAYIAPRPKPRKAKKTRTCTCPQCQPYTGAANGMFYCSAGKEWASYHNGLFIKAGEYLAAEDALRNHRYQLLRHGHGLDAEQAGDVLAALSTTN